jgi:two-component system sensor histidine kinase UhpB
MRTQTIHQTKTAKAFEAQYRSALREYAMRGGERALRMAYELGRRAVEARKSLIEVASLHIRAHGELVDGVRSVRRDATLSKASASFLTESLAPYEMAHRGFQDAMQALRQVNETLEQEIKRIAYAVHDDAGQLLVAVRIALAELSREIPKPQQASLRRIEQLLDQVETQLRRFAHELRPTILDDLGWLPAIRFLADGVTKRSKLLIEIDATFAQRLPRAVETALYRVVQEALTNATKHARASRVSIQVCRAGRTLCCSIRDDGRGFECGVVRSDRKRGLGLVAMRERLNAIGGTLSIQTTPGRGTKLSIRIPMQ